jgi:hypothetical protein
MRKRTCLAACGSMLAASIGLFGNGGQLTEVPSSPTALPAGGSPSGIVNI